MSKKNLSCGFASFRGNRKRGRPKKDRRLTLRIAAAVDWRGTDEKQLTFLFRGVSSAQVRRVFHFLVGGGTGIARLVTVTEEHDGVKRNRTGYWRTAVAVSDPDWRFCTLDDMKLLIEAVFRRLHPCTLRWYDITKFINV